jgi:Leucine-rich repeat (LRR) protein
MYHSIHELSLNHNHIEKLDGIESFSQLRQLSLNFNCISSYDELKKITKELRELELKQNPKLSIDKERLMSIFPKL